MADIDQRLGALPRLTLPLLADDIQGRDALEAFAGRFSQPR